VPLDLYLEHLTGKILEFYDATGRVRYDVARVEAVVLSEEQTLACGLITTELVSNALLHAFPDGRSGRVRVSFVQSGTQCLMSVSDDGIGFEPPAKSGGGHGMWFIEELAKHHLQGKVSHLRPDTGGATLQVEFSADPTPEVRK
jgi:two-component sensor histidine kinase